MSEVIRSISDNQEEILKNIRDLHCGGVFDCDCSYGNGSFYKNIERPKLCFDIEPLFPFVVNASSEALPLADGSLNSIVADFPFLCYIRKNRIGNGGMVMARRFSGYWRYSELQDHYQKSIKESARVLKKKGKLVFKCQDQICDHQFKAVHCEVIQWAKENGLRLIDNFVLVASHRFPSPNRKGQQRHARIFHSFFLVFEKIKRIP